MNALRHVTYRDEEPWISEEDLVLTKTLGQRIHYVRTKLRMTQRQFATKVGLADSHYGVGRWEKGTHDPSPENASKIAALAKGANYRPEAFSLRGAEALVVESAVPRLGELEGRAVGAVLTLRSVLEALAASGIQVPLPPEAVEFLATGAPTTPVTP